MMANHDYIFFQSNKANLNCIISYVNEKSIEFDMSVKKMTSSGKCFVHVIISLYSKYNT